MGASVIELRIGGWGLNPDLFPAPVWCQVAFDLRQPCERMTFITQISSEVIS